MCVQTQKNLELLLSSVVFAVQTEAYQLEGIHKEKEGMPTKPSKITFKVVYSLLSM